MLDPMLVLFSYVCFLSDCFLCVASFCSTEVIRSCAILCMISRLSLKYSFLFSEENHMLFLKIKILFPSCSSRSSEVPSYFVVMRSVLSGGRLHLMLATDGVSPVSPPEAPPPLG